MEICGVNIDFERENGYFLNADCMDGMKEFPDGYFNLAIVDPPYGGVTQGGYMKNLQGGGVGPHKNDYHLSLWDCPAPDKSYFDELRRVSKNQIIWGGNYYASLLEDSQCWVVWDKQKSEGIGFADVELAWTSFDKASRIFHFMWNGMLQGNMKHKETKIHPTQKPIALYEWLLSKFAAPGDIILDTHVGSASSLIACRNMHHKYVGFELDKTYYELAKKRLDNELAQMNIFDLMED